MKADQTMKGRYIYIFYPIFVKVLQTVAFGSVPLKNPSSKTFGTMCIFCTPRPIYRSTYRPMLDRYIGRYLGRYSGRHSADTLTFDYRRNIGRLSVVYRSTVL